MSQATALTEVEAVDVIPWLNARLESLPEVCESSLQALAWNSTDAAEVL